jgi:hypothetical protein
LAFQQKGHQPLNPFYSQPAGIALMPVKRPKEIYIFFSFFLFIIKEHEFTKK